MSDYYIPKPIPELEAVIAAQVKSLRRPEEMASLLQRVRNDLHGMHALRDTYNSKHRGKTSRRHEVARLRILIDRVEETGLVLDGAERAWVGQLLPDIGKRTDLLRGELGDVVALLRELAERLWAVSPYRLDRKWRPYLYGIALPEIGWDTALIPPKMDKDDDGEHCGLIIDFVRACLSELGEGDAKPETIAHEVKRNRIPIYNNLSSAVSSDEPDAWRFDFPVGTIAGKKPPPVT